MEYWRMAAAWMYSIRITISSVIYKLLSIRWMRKGRGWKLYQSMRLIKGGFPKADECVIEYNQHQGADSRIGEMMTLRAVRNEKLTRVISAAQPIKSERTCRAICPMKRQLRHTAAAALIISVRWFRIPTSTYYTGGSVDGWRRKEAQILCRCLFRYHWSKKTTITALGGKVCTETLLTISKGSPYKARAGQGSHEKNKKKYETEEKC